MRRSGRTTRIVDAAIQKLFINGETTIVDHHWGESLKSHRMACDFAFNILIRRIHSEHGGLDSFIIDKSKHFIKIKYEFFITKNPPPIASIKKKNIERAISWLIKKIV